MDENNEKNSGIANLKHFPKGVSGNPNGRPKGTLNYQTKMRMAIEAVAQSQNKTPEELEELIYKTGIKQAMRGDWKFYEDYMNRVHGKPLQPTDVTSNGETIEGVVMLPPKEKDES